MENIDLKQKVIDVVMQETGINLKGTDHSRDLREQVHIDSLQFVSIIATLVEEFNIEVPLQIMSRTTLQSMLDDLQQAIAEQANAQ